ncbi:bifunctional diaminohydroxyphosphoribosylaminopyrimidine deaminase/5-amino-6-(5-phosphoribosylamino)uracil reductase RibD [Geofilum sp. OHC36d9]|uniref:bifunctional diaminohydroxyphosphoribosylaminopyrimidine deaminase/5-amino-6-(5-phosphoribosylamino)uracil reductase RibD n=1 Tax=Geofilum sp. OHC36d9 TaxID=3458413 RepID=UPI004033E0B4
MTTDEKYMQRCLDLARQAEGLTQPNPMVGSVVVHNNQIIGEGFHQKAGLPHAEVNAINSVKNQSLLKESTLYVNLEPCAHYGKTPPCSLLIIKKKIPRVVIGCTDSFSAVSGKGIQMLKEAGINVVVGTLGKESREINRRFFTFHEQQRPYVILKWAQTRDGLIDYNRKAETDNRPNWITSESTRRLVHLWRSREQSIMVGSVTALKDNPSLTVRDWSGPHPLRIVLDRKNALPRHLALFDGTIPTLLFTGHKDESLQKVEQIVVPSNTMPVHFILNTLFKRGIQSLIVEGGAKLLNAFIESGLWDEARVFTGNKWFENGIKAPSTGKMPVQRQILTDSELLIYRNNLII